MTGDRLRISPEVIAAMLSAIVIAVVGFRVTTRAAETPSESSPAVSAAPQPSDGLAPVVRSSLGTIVIVNGRLTAIAEDLDRELARTTPRISEVAVMLPRITAVITAAEQPVRALVGDPATATLGVDLETAYGTLTDLIRTTLRESKQNQRVYFQAGAGAAKRIAALAPLTKRARDILAASLRSRPPSASGRPAASSSAPPLRTTSPRPSASTAPTGTAVPRSAPPGSVAPGGLVVNPGFETDVAPWQLRLTAPAAATLVLDPKDPAEGRTSARIDITTPATARSGIALVQANVAVQAGQSYVIQFRVRAGSARDIRVRVTASGGQAYIARVIPATTAWTTASFELDSLVDDPTAELAFDLGQGGGPVWIDAVGLRDLTAGG